MQNLQRDYEQIEKETINAVKTVIVSARFTSGDEIVDFEKRFARFCSCSYSVATNSGTHSLVLALRAVGIGYGDEVITTPLTFVATAEAIALVGAIPVFVDVDKDTFNLDSKSLEAAVTQKTKAVIVVHLYGICCDMERIVSVAKKYSFCVIEDASHAHGSIYGGKPAGSLGDVGCFSMHPTKTLGAMGNAGAVTTNSYELFKSMRKMADHGRWGKRRYYHNIIGETATIDAIQAAVLNVKLKYLPQWIQRRNEIAQEYMTGLAETNIWFQRTIDACVPSRYAFTIRVEARRNEIAKELLRKGVQTRVYYPTPVHLQPSFLYLRYAKGSLPVSEFLAKRVISLPIYPSLTEEEVEYVINTVRETLSSKT